MDAQQLMDQQLKEQIAAQNIRLGTFEQEQKANNVLLVKLDTKFDFMALSIKTLTEVMNDKFTKFEIRVADLERIRDQVNPPKVVATVEAHDRFIEDFKSTHKERNMIIGQVFAAIAFLISVGGFIFSLIRG